MLESVQASRKPRRPNPTTNHPNRNHKNPKNQQKAALVNRNPDTYLPQSLENNRNLTDLLAKAKEQPKKNRGEER